MSYFVGVDVGASKSASALIDERGSVLGTHWREHQGSWKGKLADTVLASTRGLMAEAEVPPESVQAYGIAVCGLVSNDGATLVQSRMLGEGYLDLAGQLRPRLGRPVLVVNDANASLYGHVKHAGVRPDDSGGSRVTLLLTLGTGVGGAFMVDDTIVVGDHGLASELGHIIVDFADERRCVCGNRGCVENFSCGRGISEMAELRPPPPDSRAILAELGATPPYASPQIVIAAERGDPWAADLLRVAGTMLGRAISVLSVVLDPDTVIIGGSFGHATSSWLLPAAVEEMKNRWSFAPARRLPRLVMDSIGPYAAATGAAMLAAARFQREMTRD
jgi:glucokinase